MFQGAEVSLGEIILHYSSWTPSIGPWGMEGIRLTRIADFPFIRSSERREIAWLQTSLSSLLAIAIAIFLTSFTAALCQPPRDSNARGWKTIPCLSQSSAAPRIFLSYAKFRLWPGVTAASFTVACCSGLTTVMSRAASRPADQFGIHQLGSGHCQEEETAPL